MAISLKPLTVSVQYRGGDALLTFKEPRLNKLKEAQVEEDWVKRLSIDFEGLVSIEGALLDEEGKELSVQDIKTLAAPHTLLLAISTAFYAAAFPKTEEDPKKENSVSE